MFKKFLGILFILTILTTPLVAGKVIGGSLGSSPAIADLEVGTYSIDGDDSAGLAFDPDNDGTNEVTIDIVGEVTAIGFDASDTKIVNVANATTGTDALNLRTAQNLIGIGLIWWLQGSNVLGTSYTLSIATNTEVIDTTPDTFSTIYYKSTVANTPTPMTISEGTEILVHFQSSVDTTSIGKTVSMQVELWYVDSDGSGNPVQINSISTATDDLTILKTLYNIFILVADEVTIPTGKRLWLKFIATASTLSGYSPTVSIYDGDLHDHVTIPVQGNVLNNYANLAIENTFALDQTFTSNIVVNSTVTAGIITDGVIVIEDGIVEKAISPVSVITDIAITLTAANGNYTIFIDTGTAITVTLPEVGTEDLPDGFNVAFVQIGAGAITFVVEGSDVLESYDSVDTTKGDGASAAVIKISDGFWHLTGNLE